MNTLCSILYNKGVVFTEITNCKDLSSVQIFFYFIELFCLHIVNKHMEFEDLKFFNEGLYKICSVFNVSDEFCSIG